MAIGRTNVGGANSLNFKVVASATEPSNPKENTIWVKTSVSMPAWELSEVSGSPSWAMTKGFVYVTIEGGDSTGGKNFNAIKANDKTMFLRVKGCIQNQDGATSGWKSMDAYIYKSGYWVQFSSVFTATINVTCPAGSTVTCKNGSTTLTGTATSGSYTFAVGNAGTWTVTATLDGNSDSTTVDISTSGQSVSVELSYEYILIPGSNVFASLSMSGETSRSSVVDDGDGTYTVTAANSTRVVIPIDVTKYKTMQIKGSRTAHSSHCAVGLFSNVSDPYPYTSDFITGYKDSSTAAATIDGTYDISSVTGTVYFGVQSTLASEYLQLMKVLLDSVVFV